MKRNLSGIVIGFLFVALAITIVLKAFGFGFDLFFEGWWTLFIIIPSFIGLFERNNRTTSAIGLGVGILLLLSTQDIIEWEMFGKLVMALIFLVIGLSIVLRKGLKPHEFNTEHISGSSTNKNYSAFFGGRDVRYDNEVFKGANITVAFGGVGLNLKNAIIDTDVIIDGTCAFGGIDIMVPSNVRVEVNCTPIFGGVDNKVSSPVSVEGVVIPTIYVNATCIFGGIDIK